MKRAFDLASVCITLQRGINSGRWTLEDLDRPSHGWKYSDDQAKRISGLTTTPFKNILRDDLPTESVQPINPRDFDVAAATRPNKGSANLDLHPQRWPDQPQVPDLSDGSDRSYDQNAVAAGAHRGEPSHLGATGEHSSHGPGAMGQSPLEPRQPMGTPGFDF